MYNPIKGFKQKPNYSKNPFMQPSFYYQSPNDTLCFLGMTAA